MQQSSGSGSSSSSSGESLEGGNNVRTPRRNSDGENRASPALSISSSSDSPSSNSSTNGLIRNNDDFEGNGGGNGEQSKNGTTSNGFSSQQTSIINNSGQHQPQQQQQQPQTKIHLDKTNQEIIRLIGQYLQSTGLDKTAELLMNESGCYLEHPAATKFRQHILSGDWNKADSDLKELQPLIDSKHTSLSSTTNAAANNANNTSLSACITEMKFIILEQKYLEYLEDGRPLDALNVLRNELTPLQHNIQRVHQLSSYMMCSNNQDLYQRANWEGKGITSRSHVMERLQTFLPPSVMLPPRRLKSLLGQAVEMQTEKCPCHDMLWETNIENVSLLSDHTCSMSGTFPMQTIQILTDHCDEVWFCKFSPDGLKLATGCKDSTAIIWDVDPHNLTVKSRHVLEDQLNYGVSFVEWSPDSKLLLVGGSEDHPEIYIYNVDEGKLIVKMSNSSEESLSCASFNKDGTKFVCGGTKGQFYLCNLNGQVIDSWEGVRVNSLAFRSDNKTVLAADTHHRIRGYVFGNPRNDFKIIQEQHSIMSFSLNSADRLALLNITSQGLHLWDLENKCLVRRFRGITQGSFKIYSCFGGVHESFVASGSEDHKVYIFHIKRDEPLAKLTGHTKTVNCVSWNPVYPAMLASCSDDATVRIWGPKVLNPHGTTPESDDCSSSCSSSSSWNMT